MNIADIKKKIHLTLKVDKWMPGPLNYTTDEILNGSEN
jgi:hypothetical protein